MANGRDSPYNREEISVLSCLAKSAEYWDGISREIEAAMKQHDPATTYTMIGRLKGGKQRVERMAIHDKNGMLLLNSTDTLERWKEYFQELLNVNCVVDQAPAHISAHQVLRQGEPPTVEEVP